MAVRSQHISVGTTATLLTSVTGTDQIGGFSAVIKNAGSASVFVGGSGVTTAAGFELAAGDAIDAQLERGEKLYAIAASGTVPVQVLLSGVPS